MCIYRPPGIGALLKLHPPPHLAHDFRHRPTGSLLSPSAGSPSRNATVAPTLPGNFTQGSSNLPPPSTLPSPAAAGGGNQLRGNLGPSSSSSSSHQQFQLPQLSLSTNPQVSVRSTTPCVFIAYQRTIIKINYVPKKTFFLERKYFYFIFFRVINYFLKRITSNKL